MAQPGLRRLARRGLPWLVLFAATAAVVVVVLGSGSSRPAVGAPKAQPTARLTAERTTVAAVQPAEQVRLGSSSKAIPQGFFGVGIEVREVPDYAKAGGTFARALALMRPNYEAAMPLRVGGYSADEAYWRTSTRSAPSGVFKIGTGWLRKLAAVARHDRVQVTLAMNLAVHSPAMAASFAHAVSSALAPGALAGAVIGDEPDLYGREPWLAAERVATTASGVPPQWTAHYAPADYRRDFRSYVSALRAVLPGLPVSGPELAGVAGRWVRALNGLGSLRPAAITVHRYPSSCRPANSPKYPTIPLLLSERASTGLAAGIGKAIGIARQLRRPLVVSEVNSASCAGPAGVTDSFATALWAPDALFEMIRAGVHGVDWHLRPYRLNSPFELAGSGILPQPELYGLNMFGQMLKPGARLVYTQTTGSAGTALKAWAVRSTGSTQVLLINKGGAAAGVSVNPGRVRGAGRIERLSAPSVSSTTGVTLAGRSISSAGRWLGRERLSRVSASGGAYLIDVPAYSAALVSWTR